MDTKQVGDEDKSMDYGITLADSIMPFLQNSSVVCDNVTVTLPLPSIQSWLYPTPMSVGELSLTSGGIVAEAFQQISSGFVQADCTDPASSIPTKVSREERSIGQGLNVCNVMELVEGKQSQTEDKGQSLTLDLLQDERILTPGPTQGSPTFDEKTEPITPLWHAVPLDLIRLLRGETLTITDEDAPKADADPIKVVADPIKVDAEPTNKIISSNPKRTYKVLTTVATQTIPVKDLENADKKLHFRNSSLSVQHGGKTRLESCRYLYQFLEAMLSDPAYDDLIQWKNKQERTFTLIDHNKVAHLWGVHKRKKSMTYDKFSRALRFYYSKNILKKESARFTYRFLTKEGTKLPF